VSDPAASLMMIATGVAIAELSDGFPVSAHRSRIAFRECRLRQAVDQEKLIIHGFVLETVRSRNAGTSARSSA
jgi:hypothetical protein